MSFHESGVYLSVRKGSDGFQEDDDGAKELLLFVQNSQIDIAVCDVVKSESLGEAVFSDTSHLHCELCISWTSVGVGGP